MAFLICSMTASKTTAMWLKPLGAGYTANANHAGRFTGKPEKPPMMRA